MHLIHKTRCELFISEDYKYHSAIHDLSFCLSNPRIREMWKENSNFPPLFLPSLFQDKLASFRTLLKMQNRWWDKKLWDEPGVCFICCWEDVRKQARLVSRRGSGECKETSVLLLLHGFASNGLLIMRKPHETSSHKAEWFFVLLKRAVKSDQAWLQVSSFCLQCYW